MKAEGLTIKNGRLINNRPNHMTGIQEAAMYRQQMKKQYKIDCIADGIDLLAVMRLSELREKVRRAS